jgi:hypothetical protein
VTALLMKITADTLTDAQIRALQDEAEREDDVEYIRICLRAYRGGGCGANPHARAHLASLLDERRHWEQGEA